MSNFKLGDSVKLTGESEKKHGSRSGKIYETSLQDQGKVWVEVPKEPEFDVFLIPVDDLKLVVNE